MLGSANLGPMDFCKKLIQCHRSTVGGPTSMKSGKVMPYNMPIMAIWSKSNLETDCNMANVSFSKLEVIISQP